MGVTVTVSVLGDGNLLVSSTLVLSEVSFVRCFGFVSFLDSWSGSGLGGWSEATGIVVSRFLRHLSLGSSWCLVLFLDQSSFF